MCTYVVIQILYLIYLGNKKIHCVNINLLHIPTSKKFFNSSRIFMYYYLEIINFIMFLLHISVQLFQLCVIWQKRIFICPENKNKSTVVFHIETINYRDADRIGLRIRLYLLFWSTHGHLMLDYYGNINRLIDYFIFYCNLLLVI